MSTALAKPARRGPKPRKPIARTRKGKGRKTSKRRASRMQLRGLADQLFSLIIRLASGGRCRTCGAAVGPDLQCAHIISRRYFALRWESTNAWGLCDSCHKRYTHDPVGWHFRVINDFAVEADPTGNGTVEAAREAGRQRLDELMRTADRGLDAPPLYDEIVPLLADQLEATHRAVPYTCLTERLHELASQALEKAERMGMHQKGG